MRSLPIVAVLLVAATVAAACTDDSPTEATAAHAAAPAMSTAATDPMPIASEPLTQRHVFTDEVSVQVRVKPEGRSREVINIQDASRLAVVRFTVQPGVRFPWHSHPGLVMVAVTQGDLVFVYGDDCIERRYPMGTAFVDPGFGNVHYAYNPTGGELVIVATFLGVPAAPAALTNPVSPAEAAAFDAKCGAASAAAHSH